jgi:3-methyladenine DNA glycosylase AlkC
MCISMSKLAGVTFPEVELAPDVDGLPFIPRLRSIGSRLYDVVGPDLTQKDTCWVSDTVRGWVAMGIASDHRRPMVAVFADLRAFAVDHHFAVREWAWLAARPRVVEDPLNALRVLEPYFASTDPFDRRFAVEVTRPRSVWGRHIRVFKERPELAETSLEVLKCEPHPYARRSVSNWLRDASRSRPDWAVTLTTRWLADCSCPATRAVVRRAIQELPR